MSPYVFLSSSVGTAEAASLCARLTAWHDAMVAHERRLRTGRTGNACGDECPHGEARTLWTEALATLGPRAGELTFLRSRARTGSLSPQAVVAATTIVSVAADGAHARGAGGPCSGPGPIASTAGRRVAQGSPEP